MHWIAGDLQLYAGGGKSASDVTIYINIYKLYNSITENNIFQTFENQKKALNVWKKSFALWRHDVIVLNKNKYSILWPIKFK